MLHQFSIKALSARVKYSSQASRQTAGFTMIELLVVIIIVGILSAIAAPSWQAFTNRQRVNKVNDLVLSALQEAQREAKRTKRNYSVWFRQPNASSLGYEYAVVSGDLTASDISIWKSLGGDVGADSKFVMRTNIAIENKNNPSNTTASNTITTAKKYITFDYMGTLPDTDFGTPPTATSDPPGLRIVVAVPQVSNSTQPSDTKRCVIIQTILGGMRTAKDKDCD